MRYGQKGITGQATLANGQTAAQWAAANNFNQAGVYQSGNHVWTYEQKTLSQDERNVFNLMNQTLQSWGLGTLSADLKNLILQGDTAADTLALALSQTKAYKERFSANEERIKKGLPELTPAQYIATEEQYRNILQAYGMPKGFYDQHQDLSNFIANDISPSELDKRAQIAAQQYQNAPQTYKDVWEKYYGFTPGDAIANILDPNHESLQDLQNRANSAAIGGTALQNGLQVSRQRAEQFNANGVTLNQAQAAYQKISESLPTDQKIAQRFGTTFGQTQEENDLLLNQGADTQLREKLYGEEKGLFEGHSGADARSLGVQQSY
jgi:hypothetical protein